MSDTVPRGQNEKFRERVGKLSEPLLFKDIRKKLEAQTEDDVDVESIDLESLIDSTLRFEENWSRVKDNIPYANDRDIEDLSRRELENEIEKYEYYREKYEERHGVAT